MSNIDSDYKKILSTEWSLGFEKLVRNRLKNDEIDEKFFERCKWAMIQSYYKYGRITQNHGEDNCMDAIANLYKRIEMYVTTRNLEFLCDAYNFAMIEYMSPQPTECSSDLNYKAPLDMLMQASDRLMTISTTVKTYEEMRKSVYLVEIATFIVTEYMSPSLSDTFFKGTDSDQAELIGFGVNQLNGY